MSAAHKHLGWVAFGELQATPTLLKQSAPFLLPNLRAELILQIPLYDVISDK